MAHKHQASDSDADLPHGVLHEGGFSIANTAPEQNPLDTQAAKGAVGLAAGSHQVDTSAGAAPMPMRVVLRKAIKPGLAILRMRLGLLQLRAQIGVLALQRPDALSQKGQMLAQHRRTASLVDERLNLLEQRLKHFVVFRGLRDREDATTGSTSN